MNVDLEFIRKSWKELKSHSEDVGQHFFETLSDHHPELVPLFEGMSVSDIGDGLFDTLNPLVDALDDEGEAASWTLDRWSTFSDSGIQKNDIQRFGKIAVQTFGTFFDEDWADDVETQWGRLFDWVKETVSNPGNAKKKSDMQRAQPPKKPKPFLKSEKKEQSVPPEAPANNQKKPEEGAAIKSVAQSLAGNILRQALEEELNDEFYQLARDKAREILKKAIEDEVREALKKAA